MHVPWQRIVGWELLAILEAALVFRFIIASVLNLIRLGGGEGGSLFVDVARPDKFFSEPFCRSKFPVAEDSASENSSFDSGDYFSPVCWFWRDIQSVEGLVRVHEASDVDVSTAFCENQDMSAALNKVVIIHVMQSQCEVRAPSAHVFVGLRTRWRI